MKRRTIISQRLLLIFILGSVLLNYPLLSIFDRPKLIAGIPMLFLFVFTIWLMLILLTAIVLKRKN